MSAITIPTMTEEAREDDEKRGLATGSHAKGSATSPNYLEEGTSQQESKANSEKEGEFEMVGWDEGEAAK
jgi:hypothetical protein